MNAPFQVPTNNRMLLTPTPLSDSAGSNYLGTITDLAFFIARRTPAADA
jgi:hypothetical protein